MKKLAIGILVFLLALVPVMAANYTYSEVGLTFRDIESDNVVHSLPISLVFQNSDYDLKIESKKFIDINGVVNYKLSPGFWKVEVLVDNPRTPIPDYHGIVTLDVPKGFEIVEQTVYIEKVGFVDGFVTDEKGSLVKNAEVNLKCGDKFSTETTSDDYGSFDFGIVPVGDCKVSAKANEQVGFQKVNVGVGNLTEVSVSLDSSFLATTPVYYFVIVIIIFVIVAYFVVRISKKKFKKKKGAVVNTVTEINVEPQETIVKEISIGPTGLNLRAKDLIKTLNAKEKKIVQFLLDHDDKGSQARIRDSTGIPKTSLARLLDNLESKNIIRIEKIGKLKKVYLTDWFLGKD